MQPVPQYPQRVFWSLYGRFVWDAQKAPWKAPQIQHIVETVKARRATAREHVLDAGCGTGDYAIALAKAGFQVTGIDYAVGMLSCAQAKVSDELVEHSWGDAGSPNGTPMLASSGYLAQVDADLCAACGTCADSCQFAAISIDDGFAHIDAAACMGCGVCIQVPAGSHLPAARPGQRRAAGDPKAHRWRFRARI
jgi:TPP-dependent indolepyruvate ferredoxin oxidoreductase alpha subunit